MIVVTLRDVAARAGVSRSTASLVINKSPLVKDETRLKVEAAIQELGYVPNTNARGLVKRENKSFGVIIAIEDQPYNTYEYNYETGLYSYNITNGIPIGLANTDYGLLTERFCCSTANGELPALVKMCIRDSVLAARPEGSTEDEFRWNWEEGEMMEVSAYTNCGEIELFLNGASFGKKPADPQNPGRIVWRMPFVPGTLLAKGMREGKPVEAKLSTAGSPAQVVQMCIRDRGWTISRKRCT